MSTTPPRPFNEIPPAEPVVLMPYHIAFVIDGTVQQVFHVDERLASVILSNPTIVQCEHPDAGGPEQNWTYDATTNTFAKPVEG
jgi:hypothetical protein